MQVERTSVGLDVHARSVVACAIDGLTGEITKARLTPDHGDILGWLARLEGPVRVAYEAGPTGFGLARALEEAGIGCLVAAPSKITRAPGDRVKTDARDAMLLARLLRIGDLVAVRVPTRGQEAARDLVRAREDARGDLMAARHRVSKLLLRQGIVYSAGAAWTGQHEVWLRAQAAGLSLPGQREAFEACYEAVLMIGARRDRLDTAIATMAADSEFTPIVRKLQCLRGISDLTGLGLAVELGDWERFTGASIGAFLGLVPTEHSSGQTRAQGSITKTGNGHARRLLVEAAWHHRRPYPGPSLKLRSRWKQAPPAAAARAHAGNQRLHARWDTFTTRRKRSVVANVAVARELAGWCWSLATLDT